MTTLMEIERAIEELPAMLESTASVFAIYDEEEGEGTQWHE